MIVPSVVALCELGRNLVQSPDKRDNGINIFDVELTASRVEFSTQRARRFCHGGQRKRWKEKEKEAGSVN